jgi:mannose-1-phosphate guanylyltransferase
MNIKDEKQHRYAVVVAGGSGTRLWPLSRKDLPKQVQKLISDKTLIEETVDRLSGLVDYEHIFISTTKNYANKIAETLPKVPRDNIIVEPMAKGTTAAFALFAETIRRKDPEAVIVSLASDHAVSEVEIFHNTLSSAYNYVEANPTNIALIGIEPTTPDTGLGYIKIDQEVQRDPTVYSVEKFVEKPSLKVAKTYLNSKEYFWNAAYYCFRADTLTAAYHEADPSLTAWSVAYIESGSEADFDKIPIKAHEIEIINAAKFPLALVPANFKWSDIGNWGALHELLAEVEDDAKMVVKDKEQHIDIGSTNSLVVSEDHNKLVATVGLDNIIVVNTKDVLLVLNKEHNQDIKQLLEIIKDKGLTDYL